MVVSQELKPALDRIDLEIEALQAMRAKLVALFGGQPLTSGRNVETLPAPNGASRRNRIATGGRVNQIVAYLKSNGPATRQDIIRNMGIPAGTVSFSLIRNPIFKKLSDDKWTVVEQGAQAEEATEVASHLFTGRGA